MRSKFANLLIKLVLLLIAATLATGCASPTRGSATKGALCDAFRPVTWSGADTDETLRQIKAHNAVGTRVCGWKAP